MDEPQTLPSDFDWVTARARCSAAELFEALRQLARVNVEQINQFRGGNSPGGPRFKFQESDDPAHRGFAVHDAFGIERRAVTFTLKKDQIHICPTGRDEICSTPVLTDGGQCKYRVGSDDLDGWQLLRRALEGLFFAREPDWGRPD